MEMSSPKTSEAPPQTEEPIDILSCSGRRPWRPSGSCHEDGRHRSDRYKSIAVPPQSAGPGRPA